MASDNQSQNKEAKELIEDGVKKVPDSIIKVLYCEFLEVIYLL